jgi:hypothetical protein
MVFEIPNMVFEIPNMVFEIPNFVAKLLKDFSVLLKLSHRPWPWPLYENIFWIFFFGGGGIFSDFFSLKTQNVADEQAASYTKMCFKILKFRVRP